MILHIEERTELLAEDRFGLYTMIFAYTYNTGSVSIWPSFPRNI